LTIEYSSSHQGLPENLKLNSSKGYVEKWKTKKPQKTQKCSNLGQTKFPPQMYQNLLFEQTPELISNAFYSTELGHLYQAIPFDALAKQIPPPARLPYGKGCKPWFDLKGGIALQVLKSYLRCSDAMLVQHINGNWMMQVFCGIQLRGTEQIKDKDIVGRWRKHISKHLDIDKLQIACVQHWQPYMQDVQAGFCDATVYESYIAYPTDAKLIWKSCAGVFAMLKDVRKRLKIRASRSNHSKRQQEYLLVAKSKKKSRRKSKKLCKSLLKYLHRLQQQLGYLLDRHKRKIVLSNRQYKRLATITTVKEQQWQMHFGNQSTVPARIVSLHKPYVRAIIRGKEVKPVEFGAKVNMLQVDGINFIEHISFDNFNEGTRLKSTVEMQKRYFGKCYQMGADAIYATNANRSYCTQNNIATSFVQKGKEGKDAQQKSQMRSLLGKTRSTMLEGSFGNEKNHYQMDKIKAKTKETESVWIFFSLLASNAKQIANRMQQRMAERQAA
jgi:IS5 family transposase